MNDLKAKLKDAGLVGLFDVPLNLGRIACHIACQVGYHINTPTPTSRFTPTPTPTPTRRSGPTSTPTPTP